MRSSWTIWTVCRMPLDYFSTVSNPRKKSQKTYTYEAHRARGMPPPNTIIKCYYKLFNFLYQSFFLRYDQIYKKK